MTVTVTVTVTVVVIGKGTKNVRCKKSDLILFFF